MQHTHSVPKRAFKQSEDNTKYLTAVGENCCFNIQSLLSSTQLFFPHAVGMNVCRESPILKIIWNFSGDVTAPVEHNVQPQIRNRD